MSASDSQIGILFKGAVSMIENAAIIVFLLSSVGIAVGLVNLLIEDRGQGGQAPLFPRRPSTETWVDLQLVRYINKTRTFFRGCSEE